MLPLLKSNGCGQGGPLEPKHSQIRHSSLLGNAAMSSGLRLTADEYGQMVNRGAFDHLRQKIELIRVEIRAMNPAGPMHRT